MSTLKWLLDNEAAWLAGVFQAIAALVIAYAVKQGFDSDLAGMLSGLVPLLVAPLLRRKVSSAATVEDVAVKAARTGEVPAAVRT